MSDFFIWLSGGSISSTIFVIISCIFLLSVPLIYTTAFIQGREVSFWPPRIGARPNKTGFTDSQAKSKVNPVRVPIIVRDQIVESLGTIQQNLENAKAEVFISGNDCKFVAESASPWVEHALRRGVSIKLLCVDPKSNVPHMLAKIDPRFPTAGSFVDSMASVEKVLQRLKRDYPRYFDFRYISILPAMGFFMTDPSLKTGIVKIEFYVSKPYGRLNSRPHIIIPPELTEWREYFHVQWNNYWELSRTPEK